MPEIVLSQHRYQRDREVTRGDAASVYDLLIDALSLKTESKDNKCAVTQQSQPQKAILPNLSIGSWLALFLFPSHPHLR